MGKYGSKNMHEKRREKALGDLEWTLRPLSDFEFGNGLEAGTVDDEALVVPALVRPEPPQRQSAALVLSGARSTRQAIIVLVAPTVYRRPSPAHRRPLVALVPALKDSVLALVHPLAGGVHAETVL